MFELDERGESDEIARLMVFNVLTGVWNSDLDLNELKLKGFRPLAGDSVVNF